MYLADSRILNIYEKLKSKKKQIMPIIIKIQFFADENI
ncbi:hypothetical protein Mucpa_6300 [Mucilaginibacter paludis DSM 18603]|uniref:Uncharacterized protein n=1 Tax=Mucilaginibacter paludis DSM 18603 TaxID=714943 RepID=H1Y3U4_9SPHI|nr:hypothetical protein Mucpa_6300 [Mucilaginibacter paludis DSM 18603]